MTRLDFNFIPKSQAEAVPVELCTVYDDLNACENGASCHPQDNSTDRADSATLSPLMTPKHFTNPICICLPGYTGEFCQDLELPVPVWAIIIICAGGLLLIALATVTVHVMWGSNKENNERQNRYLRSHPLPRPRPVPACLTVPNRPVGMPCAMPLPNEPPPPYQPMEIAPPPSVAIQRPPPPITTTFPRSHLRADEPDCSMNSEIAAFPGYAAPPRSNTVSQHAMMATNHRPPTGRTTRGQMMKRPKLGR